MPTCQVVERSWTFSGLLGAFLDLTIAYLLLCCSAVSFFVAKFLSLFGLSLPCPCNGLFGYPIGAPCLQTLLVEGPTQAVSSVHCSVKSKFPFDAILSRTHQSHHPNFQLLGYGGLEYEGDASYSSFSGSDSLKGKGAASQRPRYGLRRRRRGSLHFAKFSSGSSCEHVTPDAHSMYRSPSDPSKMENNLTAQNLQLVELPDGQVANFAPGRGVPDFEPNHVINESKFVYETSWLENLKHRIGNGQAFYGQDENACRILEHALEEEQAARIALVSELEQERISSATATDEAMAMISRLQEEKASIEIEARQYQRILEEKSAFDAEEMNLLKEIIVRHEREKHFLEEEVEFYRRALQESEGLENQVDDAQLQNEAFLNSSVDPMLMREQLNESIDTRGNVQFVKSHPLNASAVSERQTCSLSMGRESSRRGSTEETKPVKELKCSDNSKVSGVILDNDDENSQEIQEKEVMSMDKIPYSHICESSCSQNHDFREIGTTFVADEGQNDYDYQQGTSLGVTYINDQKESVTEVGELHVHDVHIIDSKCVSCNKNTGKVNNSLLVCESVPTVARRYELPFETCSNRRADDTANIELRTELEIKRSCSDVVDRFPLVSSSPSRSFRPELRRNSLPAVDYERMKIDSEIGWLRGRLRAVQAEKDKLTNSLERRERGKTELQLLEDIATQLREMRHQKEPETSKRQASLPPLSSKVTSKKRRSRSTSTGVFQSTST